MVLVQVYYGLFYIENGAHKSNGLCVTGTQKNTNIVQSMGENILKCIVVYLYCTKYNKINTNHSNVQKYICYKIW